MRVLVMFLVALAVAEVPPTNPQPELGSAFGDFLLGIFEGMKANPNDNSACTTAFAEVSSQSTALMESLKNLRQFGVVLTNLRDLNAGVNQVVNLCKMRILTEKLQNVFSDEVSQLIGIRVVTNLDWYKSTLNAFNDAFSRSYWFEAGYYGGQLLAKSFNIYV